MSVSNSTEDIKNLSFEAALAELEQIVRMLEGGTVELDKAINAYERGAALKQYCEDRLKQAQLRIDQIIAREDGSLATQPLAAE